MKKKTNIFQLLGILLIVCSLAFVLFGRIYAEVAQTKAEAVGEKIEALLPEPTPGLVGDYSNPNMPALEVSGKDYVGLISIPAYGLTLPVANQWSRLSIYSCPARFYGSVYDGTMIIGGSDQPGQFDFFSRMELGDRVSITDMLGAEFSFSVARIDRSGTADYEKLSDCGFPLTLFARSAYSAEYILIRCQLGS